MSQQQAVPKPSLQGVRIKARKGAVKAQAKHEPTGEFEIFKACVLAMTRMVGEFFATSSINILKPSPRVTLTPLHPSSSKPVLPLNISNMPMHSSKFYSLVAFFSPGGVTSMMGHPHPHSRSSRQRSLLRWMT